jgi:hypothetical protein
MDRTEYAMSSRVSKTVLRSGHQKLRNARVDPVIDGIPSLYDGAFAFISFSQFISAEVHPRACA